MNPSKFVHTLLVPAVSLQSSNPAAAPDFESAVQTSTEAIATISTGGTTEKTPDCFTALSQVFASSSPRQFVARIGREPEWTNADDHDYEALVEKEALGVIDAAEFARLEKLQDHRRRFIAPPSGEEIMFRYERSRLDQDMIALVARYVRFVPDAARYPNGESP